MSRSFLLCQQVLTNTILVGVLLSLSQHDISVTNVAKTQCSVDCVPTSLPYQHFEVKQMFTLLGGSQGSRRVYIAVSRSKGVLQN